MASPTSVSPLAALPRRLRFSLRAMLWLFVGSATLLGVVGFEARRWMKECEIQSQLQQGGGGLVRKSEYLWREPKPWLATLSPYFDPVDHITMGDASTELIAALSQFTEIRSLRVDRSHNQATAAVRFDVFPALREVTLVGDDVYSEETPPKLTNDLTTLKRAPQLRSLRIYFRALDEAQLAAIGRISTLNELKFVGGRLPVGWAKEIGGMTSLETLQTTDKATVADIEQLSRCRTLQRVYYDATPHIPYRRGLMDDDAVRAFYKLMPHAKLLTQYGDLVPRLDDAD